MGGVGGGSPGFLPNSTRRLMGRKHADKYSQALSSKDDTYKNDTVRKIEDFYLPKSFRSDGFLEYTNNRTPSNRRMVLANYADEDGKRLYFPEDGHRLVRNKDDLEKYNEYFEGE